MATAGELRAGDRFRWANSAWYTACRVERGRSSAGVELVRVHVGQRRSADVAFAPHDPVEIAGRPLQVTVSCADADEADAIARALVERRLAAAAQHWPARSVYRWNGEVRRADETVLAVKTLDTHLDAVQSAIGELHSYDTPSIWSSPAQVDLDVREWLESETGREAP